MKRLLAAFALALAWLAVPPLAADPADIAAASRSVVRVVLVDKGWTGDLQLVAHGSGFAVGTDLVVTNAHVVAPLASSKTMRIGIVPSQGHGGYFAKVVAYSPRQDLALLRLAEKGSLVPAALYTGAIADGQDVWAMGYPGVVDAAQGMSEAELMSPSAPVKTHGNVSGGRNSRGFDSILHTAQIAGGNSGGPLLDGCGRVIGANSFGTASQSSADSPFYFAVSMQEISRFLLTNNVHANLTGEPCQSLAEFQSAQDARAAGERANAEEKARAETAVRDAALAKATRQAEQDVFSSRENRMALSGLALLGALAAGGAALWLGQQGKRRESKLSAIGSAVLVVAAIGAWFSRPSLSEIDSRAKAIAANIAPSPASTTAAPIAAPASAQGQLICVIDTGQSRVTVSPTTDVPLNWRADGCVNGKTQYGLTPAGWSRILAPKSEDTVTIAHFDPASGTYRTDRFLLDAETMAKVREARGKYTPPQCSAGETAARNLGESQAAVMALLPAQPNERFVYHCSAAQ